MDEEQAKLTLNPPALEEPVFEELKKVTTEIIKALDFEATVEVISNGSPLPLKIITISSDQDLRILIGRDGQNLKALEHIVRLVISRKHFPLPEFVLDVNDYRRLRMQVVVGQALTAAERVRTTKKAEALPPMSAYERKLVHLGLTSSPEVETESIGEEPQRRVVIKPIIL